MPRVELHHSGNSFFFGQDGNPVNGSYRLYLKGIKMPMALHFVPENLLSGQAVLSVDADPGYNNIVDLAGGERICPTNFAASFFDIDLSGINPDARLTLRVI